MSVTKNTLRSALAAVSLLTLGAAPVLAADAIDTVPEPVAPIEDLPGVSNWGGAYGGVQLGYGFSGSSREPGNKVDTDGLTGGGFAGYNVEVGNGVVAGVEGDVGYSGVEGENAGTKVKSGVDGSLRGRLGYAVSPDILPYVTAGGAAKSQKVTAGGQSDRNAMLGWTAGAGLDVKVTPKTFVRGEYRYTDYQDENFQTGNGLNKVDAKDHRVQLGVGVQF